MRINTTELYRYLGQRLREQRTSLGMTQQQVAVATGQLRTSIANIEAGRQRPPLHVLYLICAELGLEIIDLLPSTSEIVTEDSEQASGEPIQIAGLQRKMPPLSAALLGKLWREEE